MKSLLTILFVLCVFCSSFAQTDSGSQKPVQDTTAMQASPVVTTVKKHLAADTVKRHNRVDSSIFRDTSPVQPVVILPSVDTATPASPDTFKAQILTVAAKKPYDSFYSKLLNNPFFKIKGKPVYLVVSERKSLSKDEMFYLTSGLLIFLAFIRLVFNRYFNNVFRLFFQPAFRQKQTREQLLQSNLPSLLLNLFFVFSAAVYITLLLSYYHISSFGFWWVLLYTTFSLLVLYISKFVFLSFAGWVFNVKDATESYIFAVYLINKILGVILVPFTLIIAFSKSNLIDISVTISLLLILVLFIYRYLASYGPVRKGIKVSILHFFFYILAFEITPLLLIYKTLIIYLDKSL